MITFSKNHKKIGDNIFDPQKCDVPYVIITKGNKHGQIEDVYPRFVNGVDLFSKYYHRDARIHVDKFVTEVCELYNRKETRDEKHNS
jgi:hypothetical protein